MVQLSYKNKSDIVSVIKENKAILATTFLVVFLTFVWGMKGAFVSDDIPGIINNYKVTSFGQALKTGHIHQIILSLVFTIFGANPAPFHYLSLFFHSANMLLFFLLTYNLLGKKTATYTVILYAIHPVVAETILWISAMNYLINTFFIFSILNIYLLYRNSDKKYLLFLINFAVFIIPLTFGNYWFFLTPFLLLAFELLFLKTSKKHLINLIPILLLSGIYVLSFAQPQIAHRTDSGLALNTDNILKRIPQSIYYVWELLIFPKNLTLYHDGSTFQWVKHGITALSTLLITIALFLSKKVRIYASLIILMFISLLPVFSPVQVTWVIAERYLYITTGFFVILLVKIIITLEKKLGKKDILLYTSIFLVISYAIRDINRTFDWKTEKSLWLATAEKEPNNAKVNNNLGHIFQVEQNWEKSIYYYKKAIELNPKFYYAVYNLSNTYIKKGDYDNAELYTKKALELEPNLYPAIHNLGVISYMRADYESAERYFKETLDIDPNYIPSKTALEILQQKSR